MPYGGNIHNVDDIKDKIEIIGGKRGLTEMAIGIKSWLKKAIMLEKGMLHHKVGYCFFCGKISIFWRLEENLRESMVCAECGSISRKRHVAKIICGISGVNSIRDLSNHLALKIYNTDIGDQFSRKLSKSESFYQSASYPDVKAGTIVGRNMSCQDLEKLTFSDGFFDIVITQDVLEHVRHFDLAIREIYRVLKPGGFHVFTVPLDLENNTKERVLTIDTKDVFIEPLEYHGDSLRKSGILVYRTFGKDLPSVLKKFDFVVSMEKSSIADTKYCIFNSIVIIAKK